MICVPCHVITAHKGMEQGQWLKKELKRTELYGKILCLVGMGNIAVEVAKRAKAFGMKVVAYRKSGQPSQHAEVRASLAEAVADADYISIHTPLTDETREMINASVIKNMKDGVVVVNTGRGNCVAAEDVAAALESGKIAAYATDVWPTDPPPDDYPLLKAPNVIMVPHLGASSKENLLRIGEEVFTIIDEYMKGA
jgi:D-3-phosphoglycerate dehydrogenase